MASEFGRVASPTLVIIVALLPFFLFKLFNRNPYQKVLAKDLIFPGI